MANRLLRNIAVSIGAGLAAGFGRTHKSRQPRRPTPNLYPILTRLEHIESRVARVELVPSPAPGPEEIEALGTLLSCQSEDIASLRQDIHRIEQRNAEQIEAFGQKVALLEQQVPAHIEAGISAKMTELEQKLRGEFQAIHYRTVDAFAETIERRVVDRINALESSLVEQSQSIVSLREKSLKTDDNLQRLLDAVEKLCARAEAQSQIALVPVEAQSQTKNSLADHYARPLEPEFAPQSDPQSEPEPELAFAGAAIRTDRPPAPPRRLGFRPMGVAILGLAILGFRYIR